MTTLYGIDDHFGDEPPRIVSTEAEERLKTYYVSDDNQWHAFLKYKKVVHKDSSLVHLSPVSALRAYIDIQCSIIRRGEKSKQLKAQAEALLEKEKANDDNNNE